VEAERREIATADRTAAIATRTPATQRRREPVIWRAV
jgi:hypothetical protein